MKKLKTHIQGLDELFQGGIEIDCNTRSRLDNSSLVIVIRGERGTNKHLFALQLMHGLTRSMRERNDERGVENNMKPQQYFSINKPAQALEDMYLDLLISRWIHSMTKAMKYQFTYQIEDDSRPEDGSRYSCSERQINYRESALRFWFDVDNNDGVYPPPTNVRRYLNNKYAREYSQMLADNIIGYNPRTNAIHYRRMFQGDSNDNLLFYRSHDSVRKYIDKYTSDQSSDIHKYTETESNVDYIFDSEFIDVEFNTHLSGDFSDVVISRNSKQALSSFQKILRKVEEEIEKADRCLTRTIKSDVEGESKDKINDKSFVHDAIVIDGFSHIDSESLKTLPYAHMLNKLRRYARVSILVFDDRREADCDGDIEIELRISTDVEQEYTYNEMQITKSTFQTRALGRHLYKRRDYGIVVFPSIHLRLTRRYYVANLINEIGNGKLEDTYSTYLASKLHSDGMCKSLQSTESKLMDYFNRFYYEDYLKNQSELSNNLLWEMYLSHCEPDVTSGMCEADLKDWNGQTFNATAIMSQVIVGDCSYCAKKTGRRRFIGYSTHYPVSVFVGNPNSYKRLLVLSKAYYWAKKKEHILFVLFDKNEEDIRKQMLCPGLCSRVGNDKDRNLFNKKTELCHKCERYIHFLGLRPGCITAEEFLSVLLEQINIYCDRDAESGIERRKLHVIIDDYQRIDFSFPFIKNTTLFTCALINICQEHNVELTILCDKSSERTHEVCTLADNVICIRRECSDIDSISLFVERMADPPFPSAIMKYDMPDVKKMFVCDEGGLRFEHVDKIHWSIIGSMKEYWRKTENFISRSSEERDSE